MESINVQTINILYDALVLACWNISERDSQMDVDDLVQHYIDRAKSSKTQDTES